MRISAASRTLGQIEETVRTILRSSRTIAIVGLSRSPWKDSQNVAQYLRAQGYRIIPINPFATELLGERCYRSLHELPSDVAQEVDVVDVFRPSRDVQQIVDEVLELRKRYGKPDTLWLQLGIRDDQSASRARAAGIRVVQDRCMKIEHGRYAS